MTSMLYYLEDALRRVCEHKSLPNVLHIVAHAALMLAEKYHSLNDECKVYHIAIGMYFFCLLFV